MTNVLASPYLTFDDRIRYLVSKDYVSNDKMSDDSREFLKGVNFHYLLGYGRNFRKLRSQHPAHASASLDDLVRVVYKDHQLSDLVFKALRILEWRLRSLYVEHYCSSYTPAGDYIKDDTYSVDNFDKPVHESIIAQIHRSREPFITEHIANKAQQHSIALQTANVAQQALLARELPIWSTVDTWTFGTLCRAIQQCKRCAEEDEWVWKKVSLDLGTPAKMFPQQLVAVQVLRNLVAHHSRLWMRPTTNTPKFPNRYKREKKTTHEKSVYVVLLVLADLVSQNSSGKEFKTQVDALLHSDPLYELGIRQIFSHELKQPVEP